MTGPDRPEPFDFIRNHMRSAPVPMLGGIQILSADKSSGLRRLAESADDGSDPVPPYWAYAWAGGIALSRYVLEHPERVDGRRVLDLGSGSGLVAIAAAKAGAAEIVAADIDAYAIAAIELNAAANGVSIETNGYDLTQGPAPDVDIVLVGDLFYEEALAVRVLAFLDRCHAAGVDVLVGDPNRSYLPRQRLRQLAKYCVRDVGDSSSAKTTSAVFALEGKPG